MAIRGRGRPRSLTLDQIRERNAAENNKEVKPGSGLEVLKRRYANKQKQESVYV